MILFLRRDVGNGVLALSFLETQPLVVITNRHVCVCVCVCVACGRPGRRIRRFFVLLFDLSNLSSICMSP